MKTEGFRTYQKNGQFMIDFVMPDEIKDILFVSIYCRGSLNDSVCGDPAKMWSYLSYNFNNINLVAPHQVHGTTVIPADSRYSLPLRPEADGVLISKAADCFASLRFADCVPVAVAGIYPEPWLLLLHSGFAGTIENFVGKGLSDVLQKFGIDAHERVWAWIGPGICGKCYSRKSADPLTARAIKTFSVKNIYEDRGLMHFDIRSQIKDQLEASGVPAGRIYAYDGCTCCDHDIFYSYRAGDVNNRLFLLGGMPQNKLIG